MSVEDLRGDEPIGAQRGQQPRLAADHGLVQEDGRSVVEQIDVVDGEHDRPPPGQAPALLADVGEEPGQRPIGVQRGGPEQTEEGRQRELAGPAGGPHDDDVMTLGDGPLGGGFVDTALAHPGCTDQARAPSVAQRGHEGDQIALPAGQGPGRGHSGNGDSRSSPADGRRPAPGAK